MRAASPMRGQDVHFAGPDTAGGVRQVRLDNDSYLFQFKGSGNIGRRLFEYDHIGPEEHMNTVFGLVVIIAALILGQAGAAEFEPVQELPYRVAPDFFQLPPGMNFGEASAVALNSASHIYLFHTANPMLVE